jgi:succinate-semialdehyde dehydrogenase/glutarate-semialdehyde dehydrogenase
MRHGLISLQRWRLPRRVSWRRTPPAKGAGIIVKAASIIRSRLEEFAVAMTLEQGKPIAQSRLEILRGCDIIDWDAQEGRRAYGRVIPAEPGMRHSVLRQPIGPVAAFSPWNFPMSSPARKVGGALSAGCSIILKASEETPAGAVQPAPSWTPAYRRASSIWC